MQKCNHNHWPSWSTLRASVRAVLAAALLAGSATPGRAQQATPDDSKTKTPPQLPPVTVKETFLREDRLVGPYKQPEWTTARRFPTTRTYVIPEGMVMFEQWWRGTFKKDSTEAHRFLSELEVGLPGRWQLDLYGRFEGETGDTIKYRGEQIEARYALADWGKIWGNPTLYLEYKNNHDDDEPHVLEGKLLFGDDFSRGWHWAVNFSYEEELGGGREIERAITFALSKSVRDSKFGIGIEGVLEHVTAHESSSETAFLIGPSFQWRPTDRVFLDVVPLFGATHDAPHSQIYVVFGLNLHPGTKSQEVSAPASSRSR